MSRLLITPGRSVPYDEVMWWRLRLRPDMVNAHGNLYVAHVDIPPDWAGHIDYFDGQNDWSQPYDYRTTYHTKFDNYGFVTSHVIRLDILDREPPSRPTFHGGGLYSGSRWEPLTQQPHSSRRPGIRPHGIMESHMKVTHANQFQEWPTLPRSHRRQV